MKTQKISQSDFKMMPAGYGHNKVTYTSPATGKQWTITTSHTMLTDATIRSEEPKRCDLERLKMLCKRG